MRTTRSRIKVAISLSCLFSCLLVAAPASQATTTTVNFDGYPAGHVMASGDVPGATFVGPPVVFTPAFVGGSPTSSAANALTSFGDCGWNRQCHVFRVDFASNQAAVTMRVGSTRGTLSELGTYATAYAYNGSDQLVRASTPVLLGSVGYSRINHLVTVGDGPANIRSIRLYVGASPFGGGSGARQFEIDDLVYSDSAVSVPVPDAPSVEITSPASDTTFLSADRVRMSGVITAASGIAQFCFRANPTIADFPATCDRIASLNDAGTGFSRVDISPFGVREGANTVRVWVRDRLGRTATALQSFRVADASTGIDFTASGLEVTQSIQGVVRDAHLEPLPVTGLIGSTGMRGSWDRYRGVPLVATKHTYARLYTYMRSTGGVGGASLPAPPALLHGFRLRHSGGTVELPGSPLWPVRAPARIDRSSVDEQRVNDGGYWYDLPASWSSVGAISLVGEVDPRSVSPRVAECGYDDCTFNNRFGQAGIEFGQSNRLNIVTIAEPWRRPGAPLTTLPIGDPSGLWDKFRTAMPYAAANVHVQGYRMSMDVSRYVNCSTPDMNAGVCTGVPMTDVLNAQEQFVDDHDLDDLGDKVVGVHPGGIRSVARASWDEDDPDDLGGEGGEIAAIADDSDYPALHETGHLIGLPHASEECGGEGDNPGDNFGEYWLSDAVGGLAGIGLDTRDGSGTSGPGLRLYDGFPRDGANPIALDVMSYCSAPTERWISTRYWTRLARWYVNYDESPFGVERRAPSHARVRTTKADPTDIPFTSTSVPSTSRHISMYVTKNGTTRFMRSRPSRHAVSPLSGAMSDWAVDATDPGGTTGYVAYATRLHSDSTGVEPAKQPLVVEAWVPTSTTSVSITSNAQPSATGTSTASANTPTINITAPVVPETITGDSFTVSWNASDLDPNDVLDVDVAWSSDNGASWRTIAYDVYESSVEIPTSMLWGAKSGKLRVTVSDGWYESSDTVSPVTFAGNDPTARILDPQPVKGTATVPASGNLMASGEAFDEAGRILTGKSLVWTIDGKVVGTGVHADLRWLDPGTHKLRLTATDASDRSSMDQVSLLVTASTPRFLDLDVPDKISAQAHSFKLTLDVSQTAILHIGTRHWAIGKSGRTIRVRVRPGTRNLKLRLRLTDGGKSTTTRVTIRR